MFLQNFSEYQLVGFIFQTIESYYMNKLVCCFCFSIDWNVWFCSYKLL